MMTSRLMYKLNLFVFCPSGARIFWQAGFKSVRLLRSRAKNKNADLKFYKCKQALVQLKLCLREAKQF